MTRKRSEFLKALGKYFEISKAVVNAVLDQGGTDEDLQRIISDRDLVCKIADLIVGQPVVAVKHVIDCDANPSVPFNYWRVEEHRKGGQLVWDPAKVVFYLSEKQKNDNYVKGRELYKELADKPVLNACVLDYLLAHPDLIPKTWKGKFVFFWGTIYRGSGGDLFVRYLYFYGGQWGWDYDWLGNDWRDDRPAVLLASK